MLRLRNKIRDVVNSLGVPVTFNYANRNQQNVDANFQQLDEVPSIVLLEIESGVFAMGKLGTFKEQYPGTAIQFIKLSKFDYNSDQNDEIIDEMKELAKLFLLKLENSGLFETLGNVTFNQLYNVYDDNNAGIEIIINAKELNSQSVCI